MASSECEKKNKKKNEKKKRDSQHEKGAGRWDLYSKVLIHSEAER